jgi:hypothetical protein
MKDLMQHININNILVEESSLDLDQPHQRKVVGGIFCNLQKTFDCVNHNILLTKLEFMK